MTSRFVAMIVRDKSICSDELNAVHSVQVSYQVGDRKLGMSKKVRNLEKFSKFSKNFKNISNFFQFFIFKKCFEMRIFFKRDDDFHRSGFAKKMQGF